MILSLVEPIWHDKEVILTCLSPWGYTMSRPTMMEVLILVMGYFLFFHVITMVPGKCWLLGFDLTVPAAFCFWVLLPWAVPQFLFLGIAVLVQLVRSSRRPEPKETRSDWP